MTTSESPRIELIIRSNTELVGDAWDTQRAMVKRLAEWHSATQTWHVILDLDQPGRTLETLAAVMHVRQFYGIGLEVRRPLDASGPPVRSERD